MGTPSIVMDNADRSLNCRTHFRQTAERIVRTLASAPERILSAANLVEVGIVMQARHGDDGARDLDLLLAKLRVDIAAVTANQADIARSATLSSTLRVWPLLSSISSDSIRVSFSGSMREDQPQSRTRHSRARPLPLASTPKSMQNKRPMRSHAIPVQSVALFLCHSHFSPSSHRRRGID
jgi:hypothetical protein